MLVHYWVRDQQVHFYFRFQLCSFYACSITAAKMSTHATVVGLGEVLWDLLPSGRQLGGAPANFAYCSQLLGNVGVVASRIGTDSLGCDIRDSLARRLDTRFLQSDDAHPTGTVNVQLDAAGQPQYEITRPVAWDFLEWTPQWRALAASADAVCFGSLAQRSPESRGTILTFLDATRPQALRVFDVNLRQRFYSPEVIEQSLRRANIVKLNHEEVPLVGKLLQIAESADSAFARELIQGFKLRLVCITRGSRGSLLCDSSGMHEHPGFSVPVKDTIGAGDAFTAALVHGLLRKHPLDVLNDAANRMGAWVASHSGAMPETPAQGLERELLRIQ
jgi:fructokinase